MAGAAASRLEKKAAEEGRTLLFLDESGFYPLPGVVRTWVPKGKTPVLHHNLTHDHLSVISTITPKGNLYLQMRETAFDSQHYRLSGSVTATDRWQVAYYLGRRDDPSKQAAQTLFG